MAIYTVSLCSRDGRRLTGARPRAGATFLVLAVSLVFAGRQVREAIRLREARARPFVVVDFEAESVLIHLTIENTGTLAARDIRLQFDPPIRTTPDDPWPPEQSTLMTQGIPTLPPGKKLRFFLDSFPVRYEKGLPLTYEATVTYAVEGRKKPFKDTYTLDLSFLVGLGHVQRKGTHEIAQELEKIRKRLDQWTEHLNGLRVYAIDHEKYERETRIVMAWRRIDHRLSGGDPEEIRAVLKEALRQVGENAEPPDAWVRAIADREEHFWIQPSDLE